MNQVNLLFPQREKCSMGLPPSFINNARAVRRWFRKFSNRSLSVGKSSIRRILSFSVAFIPVTKATSTTRSEFRKSYKTPWSWISECFNRVIFAYTFISRIRFVGFDVKIQRRGFNVISAMMTETGVTTNQKKLEIKEVSGANWAHNCCALLIERMDCYCLLNLGGKTSPLYNCSTLI